MSKKLAFPLIAAFAALACSGPQHYARTDPLKYRLTVWVDNDPSLDRKEIILACAEWQVKGVACELTNDERGADVRIRAKNSLCTPVPDGLIVLALAYHEGIVEMMTPCLKSDGQIDREKFRAVMTHEIGHVIGIWEHVSADCDGKAPKHPNGTPVCGRAVMNPTCDRDVNYVTVMDGLAFDIRERDQSALKELRRLRTDDGIGPSLTPRCIYLSK